MGQPQHLVDRLAGRAQMRAQMHAWHGTVHHPHAGASCHRLSGWLYQRWPALTGKGGSVLSPTQLLPTTPWVTIHASRRAWRVDRILAVKNPGVSLRPGYENDERVVPPITVAVLLQDIPIKNGSLLIRYPDLVITMYWVSLLGM